MKHERVAVLRGGPSEEYDTSMKTGMAVLQSLANQNYHTKDIVITKSGEWLDSGFIKSPNQVLEGVDVIFLALHGGYGEDGEVQKLLKRNNIKFTGSDSFPSALAFNKALTKRTIAEYNILTPKFLELDRTVLSELNETELLKEVESSVGTEVIVKPLNSGSSVGIKHAKNKDELRLALNELFELYDQLLVEEFIRGREATCAVLENFRDQDLYTFPVVEVITGNQDTFFTTGAKYNGQTTEVCPAQFSFTQRTSLAETTAKVHKLLGLSQYSRSDFIVNGENLYFLEVNTLPGLTKESLYPKAAESVGVSFDQLISHLITTAKR